MWNKFGKLQAHFSKVALSKVSVSIPVGGFFLLCQGNLPSAIWRREFPRVAFLLRPCLIMPFHCSNTHTHTDHIPVLASSIVTVSTLTYKTLLLQDGEHCHKIIISIGWSFGFLVIILHSADVLSHGRLFTTPWTVASQVPLSMECYIEMYLNRTWYLAKDIQKVCSETFLVGSAFIKSSPGDDILGTKYYW